MSTSGTGLVFTVCFVAVVWAAVVAAGPLLRGRLSPRAVGPAGVVLWLCVATPSLLQVPFPQLYDVLHRDAVAVLQGGQWWRVATAVVVQDGGWPGTLSNLVLLAVALVLCVPLWGARATALAFALVGVALNVSAVLLGAEDGGGSSGATLPLVASLPPLAVALSERRARAVAALVVTVVAAVVLVATGDGHGYAVAVGLVLGWVGVPYGRARERRRTASSS